MNYLQEEFKRVHFGERGDLTTQTNIFNYNRFQSDSRNEHKDVLQRKIINAIYTDKNVDSLFQGIITRQGLMKIHEIVQKFSELDKRDKRKREEAYDIPRNTGSLIQSLDNMDTLPFIVTIHKWFQNENIHFRNVHLFLRYCLGKIHINLLSRNMICSYPSLLNYLDFSHISWEYLRENPKVISIDHRTCFLELFEDNTIFMYVSTISDQYRVPFVSYMCFMIKRKLSDVGHVHANVYPSILKCESGMLAELNMISKSYFEDMDDDEEDMEKSEDTYHKLKNKMLAT